MNKALFVVIGISLIALIGCSSRSTPIPVPPPHNALYITNGDAGRVYAPPGTADSGTQTEIPQFNVLGTVNEDGSFSLDIDPNIVSKVGSTTLIPPLFSLLYTKGGKEVREDILAADATLESSITHQLFSTGSGPNDMLYGNDSLYIANSMDNTVTSHSLAGELLATSQFNEFASPSYLGMGNGDLLVTSNGENRFWQLDLDDLSGYLASSEPINYQNVTFAGPGQPTYLNEFHLVPFAWIETFSPTVYGDPHVNVAHEFYLFESPDLTPGGKNSQFAAVDSENEAYYLVSTGEIQFDEFWAPYADSDSFLTAFEGANLTVGGSGTALNLGMIGAGRIAISPDGTTAFLGNSLSGNLYMVDLTNMQVLRGEDNPIVLTTEFTFVSDVAFTPGGKYVLATSFNTDELYVIDAVSGEVNPGPYPAPFDLSLDPELLAGTANVEIVPDAARPGRYSAYVMFGVANTVAKVDLF